jgi:hypothetical protein
MKAPKVGDRIRLVCMPEDPDPAPPGTIGTVTGVRPQSFGVRGPWVQVEVDWDNGRTLMMSVPPDAWEGVGKC